MIGIKLFADKTKTFAELRHTNIPDDAYEDITTGWDENYFGSLIEFYEE